MCKIESLLTRYHSLLMPWLKVSNLLIKYFSRSLLYSLKKYHLRNLLDFFQVGIVQAITGGTNITFIIFPYVPFNMLI